MTGYCLCCCWPARVPHQPQGSSPYTLGIFVDACVQMAEETVLMHRLVIAPLSPPVQIQPVGERGWPRRRSCAGSSHIFPCHPHSPTIPRCGCARVCVRASLNVGSVGAVSLFRRHVLCCLLHGSNVGVLAMRTSLLPLLPVGGDRLACLPPRRQVCARALVHSRCFPWWCALCLCSSSVAPTAFVPAHDPALLRRISFTGGSCRATSSGPAAPRAFFCAVRCARPCGRWAQRPPEVQCRLVVVHVFAAAPCMVLQPPPMLLCMELCVA